MSGAAEDELREVTADWDRAMVTNDPEAIGSFMADDWTIIGPDGREDDKEAFLALVRAGTVTHDVMESHDLRIRVYGDTAIVTARGVSGGRYRGQPFRLVERATSVFVRRQGRWQCVLTHLSEIAND
jgi:ketosteroid isomerase-like protein